MTESSRYFVRVDGELTDEVRAAFNAGMSKEAGRIGIAPEWGARKIWSSQEDSTGAPHFRVVVAASTPEQARERVEAIFSHIPGLSVRAVDQQPPPGGGLHGRYEEIAYRAIENLVVELMTGFAAEEERLDRLSSGREPSVVITSVSIRGTYPDSRLCVSRYERSRDLEQQSESAIWQDEEFVAASKDVKRLQSWIGDFLMYKRGG